MIELFCLLPSVLKVRPLLSLHIFVFLVDKFLVILAFFDNLVEMVLLVFARFNQFFPSFAFLPICPLNKLLLNGLNPRLLLILLIQFISHLLLLSCITLCLLSIKK